MVWILLYLLAGVLIYKDYLGFDVILILKAYIYGQMTVLNQTYAGVITRRNNVEHTFGGR